MPFGEAAGSSSSDNFPVVAAATIQDVLKDDSKGINCYDLMVKHSKLINQIIREKTRYEKFMLQGKKLKDILKSSAIKNKTTGVRLYDFDIIMIGDAKPNEFTFQRLCACLAASYFKECLKLDDKSLEDLVYPALGIKIKAENPTIQRLKLVACPGANFVPRILFEMNKNSDMAGQLAKYVGGAFLMCLAIDWCNYRAQNPTSKVTLDEFGAEGEYDDLKDTFTNAIRNFGKDNMGDLTEEFLAIYKGFIGTVNDVDRKSNNSTVIRLFTSQLNTVFASK